MTDMIKVTKYDPEQDAVAICYVRRSLVLAFEAMSIGSANSLIILGEAIPHDADNSARSALVVETVEELHARMEGNS